MLQSDAFEWGHRFDGAEKEEKETARFSCQRKVAKGSCPDQGTEPSIDDQTERTEKAGEGENEDGKKDEEVGALVAIG